MEMRLSESKARNERRERVSMHSARLLRAKRDTKLADLFSILTKADEQSTISHWAHV